MPRTTLYRSLLIAGVTAAALLACGCESVKDTRTSKEVMTDRWKDAQIGVLLQIIQQQYAVGDYDEARKNLAKGLALKPDDARLHTLAAKIDIEKGTLDSAAEHLQLAIKSNTSDKANADDKSKTDDPEPHYLLGVVNQRWQRFDVACKNYQEAWDLKTAEPRYMLAVVEMKIALGQLDEAQAILQGKEAYFEQTGAVRIALARIATLRGDYATAARHYRDAVVLLPDDVNLKRSYGEALFSAHKYADAIPVLEEVHRSSETASKQEPGADDAAVQLMLGESYLQVRRPLEARACFQDITRTQPDNVQAILGLGKVGVQTNDLILAQSAARNVLHSQPQNVQALILTAVVQQKEKKWDEALTTLDKASRIAPSDSTVMCMQGVSADQLGRHDEAVAYFQRAVATNPKDAWASDLLGSAKPGARPRGAAPAGASVPEHAPLSGAAGLNRPIGDAP